MTTLEQPTAGQVKEFCSLMERSLLDALNMGAEVTLRTKDFTKEIFSPEHGTAPVDVTYTGRKYVAEFHLGVP